MTRSRSSGRCLAFWRTDTESYCRTHNLKVHFDASNTDSTYFRNKLRLALIPELEKYNPQIKEALLRTAQALQGDHAVLQEVTESRLERGPAREPARAGWRLTEKDWRDSPAACAGT